MEINLNCDDRIRLKSSDGPFIDVQHVGFESVAIDMYSFQGYIEIRKKGNHFRVFQFPKKSYKKELNFGYWDDAEIIYSFNENGKDKHEK